MESPWYDDSPKDAFKSLSPTTMKVRVKHWHAVAQWRWDTGTTDTDDGDNEGDVCGICRVPYEGCCPSCKIPGDDCPLSCVSFVFSADLCG
jgi:hypothetical protein